MTFRRSLNFWWVGPRRGAEPISGFRNTSATPPFNNPLVSGTARQVCFNFCTSQDPPVEVPAKRLPFVLSLLFREMVPNTPVRLKNVRDYTRHVSKLASKMSPNINLRQSELTTIPSYCRQETLVPARVRYKSSWLALYTMVWGSRNFLNPAISRIAQEGIFVG